MGWVGKVEDFSVYVILDIFTLSEILFMARKVLEMQFPKV